MTENCALAGHVCDKDPQTNATDCLTDTSVRLCQDFGSDCDGTSVAVCDDYSLSIFDCAAMGGTCAKQAGDALCKRATDNCTPFDATINVCNGSSISLCIGGKPVSFDCARVGISCKPGTVEMSAHCE